MVIERARAVPTHHYAVHRGRTVYGYMTDEMRGTLAMLIDRFDVRSVIEIGSFVGLAACWFADQGLDVVTIDTFDALETFPEMAATMRAEHAAAAEDQYFTFLENTAAYPNIRGIRLPSLRAAALPIAADLVYVDANHHYELARADVEAWMPHTRKVICGDDNTDQWPGVQRLAQEIGANTDQRVWWRAI